jgi:hypothetical protein
MSDSHQGLHFSRNSFNRINKLHIDKKNDRQKTEESSSLFPSVLAAIYAQCSSCVCVCCHVNTFFNTVNKAKTACACGTKSSSVRIFAWTHTDPPKPKLFVVSTAFIRTDTHRMRFMPEPLKRHNERCDGLRRSLRGRACGEHGCRVWLCSQNKGQGN